MTPAQIAVAIADDFYGKGLDLSKRKGPDWAGWSDMPEVKAVDELRNCGHSDRTVRRFLTFVSAMDRARDATRLWNDAANLVKSCPEIFDPVEVAGCWSTDKLMKVLKKARVSQRHGPDANAWRTIAQGLAAGGGAVAHLVEHGTGNAKELCKDLAAKTANGRARYPFLRGQKIGPMWIRIMVAPGGATVEKMDIVPVAVDVQVRKVTESLCVTNTAGLPIETAKPIIQCAWKNAVEEADFGGPPGIAGTCAALDPALWYYGNHGCSHCMKEGQRVPIGAACKACCWCPNEDATPRASQASGS